MSQWSDDLICEWNSWEVHGTKPKTLVLRLAPGHCCDMGGAIHVAQGLMPEVETVITYSGDKPDTVYFREGNDWQARPGH